MINCPIVASFYSFFKYFFQSDCWSFIMSDPSQPRQPKDMKGLLKFCLEATRGEDAPDISDPEAVLRSMEPDKKKWLEEALNSMSVDVVEQLTNAIKILNSDSADLEDKEEVLDNLEDWIGNIDMAINFHKIGGFTSLRSCLSCPHPSLRSGACHLMGEISQNNPYCQDKFVSEGFLEVLLRQVEEDEEEHCQVKALYALSCIGRDHPTSLQRISQLDGWSVLLRVIQRDSVKLRTKACFLIRSAALVSGEVAQQMVEMGLVVQLVFLLQQSFESYHEHILSALATLVTKSDRARDEARADNLNLETLLRDRLGLVGEAEEHWEYVEHCRVILTRIAPEFRPSEEWQEVGQWQAVPPGCQVRMDLSTGKKLARRDENTDR